MKILSPRKPIRPAIEYIKKHLGDNLVGAEIGILIANHTLDICNYIKMKKMYCIDPWVRSFKFRSKTQKRFVLSGERIFRLARKRLKTKPETDIIRKPSLEAVSLIKNRSLDFVYIDGDHRGIMVLKDIKAWRKKVKIGGIIAGHDFGYRREPAVTAAVIKYAKLYNLLLMCKPVDWWFINA